MKKIYIAISLIIVILISGLAYANNDNLNAKKLGKHIGELFKEQSQTKNEILGYVNDIEISKNKFEIFKETSLFINENANEEELLNKYVQYLLVIDKAEKEGFTVSKKEVEEYTNKLFDALENDDENMQVIKEYIDGMGITMKEYKEIAKEDSYKTLLTMKLYDKLQSEFLRDNKKTTKSSAELNDDFENYLKDYKEELFNDAEIILHDK